MGYSIIENKGKGNTDKKKSNVSFMAIEPEWTLDEIIFSQRIKEQLQDVVSFCQKKDQIVEEWELNKFLKGKGCIGINLWGIPGTGKSIAAEAIASALHKKLIQASYSTLMDSLQGNTEKNITSLFETAVTEDCVILFDEADGLLSARKTGGANSDSTNLIKSHMLNILDRSNAVVVFTTNLFKSYDRAFVRRILWNIEVPAPGFDELIKIWQLHLGARVPKDMTYEELADITINISKEKSMQITGGDVRKLTLMFCTQLASSRYSSITKDIAASVIRKYLDDLQESSPTKRHDEQELSQEQISDKVKNELNS